MTIVTQETIRATNAARVAYFENLKENPLLIGWKDNAIGDDPAMMQWVNDCLYTEESVDPEELKVGDWMKCYGYIYEITEIRVFDEKDDIPVYVTIGTYVGGDLDMYKYFLQNAQNGCAKSHFTSQQGNARAEWVKVTLN